MPGELLVLLLSWIVTNLASFAIVILDERHLSSARLERAWPRSSRDAAIIAFGPLAVPVHFVRTRGSLSSVRGALGYVLGLFLGILALALVVLAHAAVMQCVEWCFGISFD